MKCEKRKTKQTTSTIQSPSTSNISNKTDSGNLFGMIRQFKSHELYGSSLSKIRQTKTVKTAATTANSTQPSPKQILPHLSAKSQNLDKISYQSPPKKALNNCSLFNRLKKQLSSQALKKEHQIISIDFSTVKASSNKRIEAESSNILELDDLAADQENDLDIDNDIDEKEDGFILNPVRARCQQNNMFVLCTENISKNPFIETEDDDDTTARNNNKEKDNTDNNNDPNTLCNEMVMIAKKGDKEEFITLLTKCLSINPDLVNYLDNNQWSALHYACNEGNQKIVEIIIKSSCNVKILTKENQTPLHLSAKNGFFDISKLLVDNGALLNSLDNENNTPIHLCSVNGHFELIKYFIQKQPQHFDIKNINGKTAYDIAKTQEIKEFISTHFKKQETQYHKVPIVSGKDENVNSMFNKYNTKKENANKGTDNKNNSRLRKKHQDALIQSPNNLVLKLNTTTSTNNNHNTINLKTEGTPKINNRQMNIRSVEKTRVKEKFKPNTSNITGTLANNNQIKKAKNVTINLKSHNKSNVFKAGEVSEFSPLKRKYAYLEQINRTVYIYRNHSVNTSINKVRLKSKEEETKQKEKSQFATINNNIIRTQQNEQSIDISQYHTDQTRHTEEHYHNSQVLNSIEEEKISPSSFECHGLLGKGSFGEVFLVKKRDSDNLFAMKVISKNRITRHNLFKYAMVERNVLSLTNHPFIVKLYYAFQTSERLFLILEYCSGGDLAKHLNLEKRFKEDKAKFYLCEIILALEDLHERDIVFRDLKPDNIVLDKDGHVKVTDFGLSKEGVLDPIGAKSFCGSIAYLAPEMLKRTGHGKAIDWYLLGLLFYEMLVGLPPFFTDQKEEIFRNIEYGELQIPKFISKEAGQLLREDPDQRLGGGKEDAREIKQHQYFADVNWDDVYNKKYLPPKQKEIAKNILYFSKPKLFVDNDVNTHPNNNIDDQESADGDFNGWSFIQKNEDFNIHC